MVAAAEPETAHGALMDAVYRRQKHIYDATRKFYLFGRDPLIAALGCTPGTHLLEIGCGTGRNLAMIARRWRGTRLHGLDISREMLDRAGRRLGANAQLALGDAGDFDAQALFGRSTFDRVVLSYTLSMIPCWEQALAQAATLVAPGGSLHVVDFGDFGGMAGPIRRGLGAWLRAFHVTPRDALPRLAAEVAAAQGLALDAVRGPLGYYRIIVLQRWAMPPREALQVSGAR